jgi:hypothetical protein
MIEAHVRSIAMSPSTLHNARCFVPLPAGGAGPPQVARVTNADEKRATRALRVFLTSRTRFSSDF